MHSSLVLAGSAASEDPAADGWLEAWEIATHVRLEAELVTLSACQTGLGVPLAGEGSLGLTRAFLHAGARSVVSSLWRVADESTAVLMTRFYRELRAGRSKDEALRRAQVALLRDRRWRDPYHWAAFQLQGDWR
jgi:CHAT domain-containing protein